jgi:hypothetical protein
VDSPALIRLVGGDGGVHIAAEAKAWRLVQDDKRTVPLSRCDLDPKADAAALAGDLPEILVQRPSPWRFAHIAAHGEGSGLGQSLRLRTPLNAGLALGLSWPESVLMASCYLGQVENAEDAEVFGYVLALFAGGAHCVVAGLDLIPDRATGDIAAHIIEQIRGEPARLDMALRNAQLHAIDQPEFAWALLNAFAR